MFKNAFTNKLKTFKDKKADEYCDIEKVDITLGDPSKSDLRGGPGNAGSERLFGGANGQGQSGSHRGMQANEAGLAPNMLENEYYSV